MHAGMDHCLAAAAVSRRKSALKITMKKRTKDDQMVEFLLFIFLEGLRKQDPVF